MDTSINTEADVFDVYDASDHDITRFSIQMKHSSPKVGGHYSKTVQFNSEEKLNDAKRQQHKAEKIYDNNRRIKWQSAVVAMAISKYLIVALMSRARLSSYDGQSTDV